MKAVYTAALNLADNNREMARKIYQDTSIAYNKQTMLPKGAIGCLVQQYLEAQKSQAQRRKLAALRFYTCLKITGDITNKQSKKAYTSISSPDENNYSVVSTGLSTVVESKLCKQWSEATGVQPLKTSQSVARNTGKDLPRYFSATQLVSGELTPYELTEYLSQVVLERAFKAGELSSCNAVNKKFDASNIRFTSYYYSPLSLPKGRTSRNTPGAHLAFSLATTSYVPPILEWNTRCTETRHAFRDKGMVDEFVGRIGVIQEQGCKARVVAQPNAWVQLAMAPYHSLVHSFNQKVFPKEHDTENQCRGAADAANHMRNGNIVHCIDLRSATDRLPRRVTNKILSDLGGDFKTFAAALEDVASSKWHQELDKTADKSIIYGCGQPMGVYGSFPALALTNMALCELSTRLAANDALISTRESVKSNKLIDYSTEIENNRLIPFPSGVFYHVLGDDVIISDERIAKKYGMILDSLHVSTSPEKCYSRGVIAEYAGFVIRKSKKNVTVTRPYKIPVGADVDKDTTNPLQLLHAMGSYVSKFPRRKEYWKKQFQIFQKTIDLRDLDLSPVLAADEDPMLSGNRPTSRDLYVLSHTLSCEKAEELANNGNSISDQELEALLPFLVVPPNINSKPLIDEPVMRHYGYSPTTYSRSMDIPKAFLSPSKRLEDDPLMRSISSSDSSPNQSTDVAPEEDLLVFDEPDIDIDEDTNFDDIEAELEADLREAEAYDAMLNSDQLAPDEAIVPNISKPLADTSKVPAPQSISDKVSAKTVLGHIKPNRFSKGIAQVQDQVENISHTSQHTDNSIQY
jgi:hypothetical protein